MSRKTRPSRRKDSSSRAADRRKIFVTERTQTSRCARPGTSAQEANAQTREHYSAEETECFGVCVGYWVGGAMLGKERAK